VLTIGEFSRLTHLSVRTLRRYHEAALLEPAVVDETTGYRYYGVDQIPTAQVIHRLRELEARPRSRPPTDYDTPVAPLKGRSGPDRAYSQFEGRRRRGFGQRGSGPHPFMNCSSSLSSTGSPRSVVPGPLRRPSRISRK
jgi:hypothetical protein